ncbi:MAG TPA: hypothetical protein VGV38_05665, partial [Pyrinomonadaceae bacterium]|nr:hypothetical protein [Pyrinomonadaceae bacterium]
MTFQVESAAQTPQLPDGNWSLTFLPYLRADYESRPLVVTSVNATEARVAQVEVENRSEKPATAFRLEWRISRREEPDSVLLKGETRLLGLPTKLSPRSVRAYNVKVVSFEDVYKPLAKNGLLNGDFRIEVAVGEVRYDDGSTWVARGPVKQAGRAGFVKVSARAA